MGEALKPKSLQKHPTVYYTVNTEMTAEGHSRRTPTAERPMYYWLHANPYQQLGIETAAGEQAPPVERLEAAMKAALAANHYLPLPSESDERPELFITFTLGSHGMYPQRYVPDTVRPIPIDASELVPYVIRDSGAVRDILARARLIAGDKYAVALRKAFQDEARNMHLQKAANRTIGDVGIEYPLSPDFTSPFMMFVHSGELANGEQLVNMAFNTCYFVIATASDYNAVERGERIALWRTNMSVEANGVALEEITTPMIAHAAPHFGRETKGVAIEKRQLDRTGTVTVGTPTVVQPQESDASARATGQPEMAK